MYILKFDFIDTFVYSRKTCTMMNNYRIRRLVDKDPVLCQKLRQWCYDLNGCCQEVHKSLGQLFNEYMYKDSQQFMLCPDHRQQLWNYMRLTKTRIGVLWNFAPTHDQSEHYYLDVESDTMYLF